MIRKLFKINVGFFTLILVIAILLTGCITTDVKEQTISGTITSIDVGGTSVFPFGIVSFDDGTVFSPLTMDAYGKLSSYLNKEITVTFIPGKRNGAWYDVKDIIEG